MPTPNPATRRAPTSSEPAVLGAASAVPKNASDKPSPSPPKYYSHSSPPSSASKSPRTPEPPPAPASWRAHCWANLELTESKPRVRRGDRIRFGEPFTFAGGLNTTSDTEFEVIERDVLRVVDRGIRVRIPRWRARRFEKAGQ